MLLKKGLLVAMSVLLVGAAGAVAQEEDTQAFMKADDNYKRMHFREAIEQFREILRQNPNYAKAHQRLAACLAASGDEEAAILEAKQAIKLDPKYFLSHVVLGQLYANQGKIDPALEEFREAVKLKPTSFRANMDLGFALAAKGKHEEGIQVYKKLTELEPTKCTPFLNLGVLYGAVGKWDEAITAEKEAIKLSQDKMEKATGYINLGNIYADKEDFDNALTAYKDALSTAKDHPHARSGVGWMLQKKGDLKNAILEQRKAIKIQPSYAPAYVRLASALGDSGDPEASKAFQKALEMAPRDYSARVEYARFLAKQGKKDDAISQYKKALDLNPKSKIAQDGLAQLTKTNN